MSEGIKPEWIKDIAAWAAGKPRIAEVFLYGSRVKGSHGETSDLDIAVRIYEGKETPLTTWIFEGKEWAKQLDELLDVEVHLEMVDQSDTVVLPSVRDHGVRIYARCRPRKP